jgi:hypothetical protein
MQHQEEVVIVELVAQEREGLSFSNMSVNIRGMRGFDDLGMEVVTPRFHFSVPHIFSLYVIHHMSVFVPILTC